MAKEKTKTEEKEEKETAPEFKYGVTDLADALDLEPASVRVKLRAKKIEKAGKSYGWNTKAELDAVIAKISAKAKDEDDEDEAEKPARKSKKK